MHGTSRFLNLSHLLYGICVKIFIMNRYISKSYKTARILLTDNIYRAGAAVVSTITSLWTGLWSRGVGRGKSEKACRQTFGIRGGVNVFPSWCVAIVFLTRWRSFPSHVVFLRSFCVKPNQVRGNQPQSLIFSSFGTFRVASRNLPFSVIPFTKITRASRKTSSMHPWPKGRID